MAGAMIAGGDRFDLVVVGGGIVGTATALAAQARQPGARILLLEKEATAAAHQSGHNSGVIHAGVYYAPGSLKARFCREGVAATRAYCDAKGLGYQICGKLIVATTDSELARMEVLYQRASANGIEISRVSQDDLRRMEPHVAGLGALLSPSTGIVDFGAVARHMAGQFVAQGGALRFGVAVRGGRATDEGVRIETTAGGIDCARAVVCAGLHSDRMVRAFGGDPGYRVVPFRGEYFRIRNQPADLVRRLIYPVPDPARPFLGVHLTRKLDGGFTVGPNAVLALAREGYRRRDISLRDLAGTAVWPGFWRMLARNARAAAGELASSSLRRLYLRQVQRYCPRVRLEDLTPYPPGVRAQAVARDGRIIDDFLFQRTGAVLHVCNAPSPAATSAIPIAGHVLDELGW